MTRLSVMTLETCPVQYRAELSSAGSCRVHAFVRRTYLDAVADAFAWADANGVKIENHAEFEVQGGWTSPEAPLPLVPSPVRVRSGLATQTERTAHYATHAALVSDDRAWSQLKLVGRQYMAPEDGYMAPEYGLPEETLELRNCPCGATLARRVPVTDEDRRGA